MTLISGRASAVNVVSLLVFVAPIFYIFVELLLHCDISARQWLFEKIKHFAFGPGRTGPIFVYFVKKSVTSSPRQVRLVIFRSTKFCQGLPNFKDAVVLPQSSTNFCQA